MGSSASYNSARRLTRPDGGTIHFDVEPLRKHCLLNGLDDIGLTLRKETAIAGYEAGQRTTQPWLWR